MSDLSVCKCLGMFGGGLMLLYDLFYGVGQVRVKLGLLGIEGG